MSPLRLFFEENFNKAFVHVNNYALKTSELFMLCQGMKVTSHSKSEWFDPCAVCGLVKKTFVFACKKAMYVHNLCRDAILLKSCVVVLIFILPKATHK